jgi:hypothetical protein
MAMASAMRLETAEHITVDADRLAVTAAAAISAGSLTLERTHKETIAMMILAGMHMHHAAGGWPIWIGVGVLLLVIACAAVVLLARRPAVQAAGGRFGPHASYLGGGGSATADNLDTETDDDALDARILEMLRQKGEPMPQAEIAANLGMDLDVLGSWLAGMERRERLGRTWDAEQSTYVVHLRDEA